MTIQLQSTHSVEIMPHCIVYGPAKIGKTRLIPTCDTPVVCSCDEGLMSIRQHNIPFVRATNWDQIAEFIAWVKSGGAKQFKTIVFDDLTELASLWLVKHLPRYKDGRQAYGDLADELLAFIRAMRIYQGSTIVWLCKQERIQNDRMELIYSPMIPGRATAPLLAYLVGQIYHMELWTDPNTNQVHEVLRCKRTNEIEAGDRSGKLAEIEFANLGAIIAKVLS